MVNSFRVSIELELTIFGYDITISIHETYFHYFQQVGIDVRFPIWLHPTEEEFKKFFFNFTLKGTIEKNVTTLY